MKVGVDSVILGAWVRHENPKSILDIGAGTGLLSLMMAQRFPESQIVAVELDADAILDARGNFQRSKFASRLDLIHASIQDFTMLSDRRFELIISNPPYFDNGNRSELMARSKARHQDALSLEELFDCVATLLAENGSFSLILPFELKDVAVNLGCTRQLFLNAALTIFPTPEKGANRVVLQFGHRDQVPYHEALIVRDKGPYTEAYKSLTKAFYL